jgi:hypothetical protein
MLQAMTSTSTPPRFAPAPQSAAIVSLDDLAALTADQLLVAYRAATTPVFSQVTGDCKGRMLALQGLRPGLIARALRRFAAWRFFPWRGKSFTAPPSRPGAAPGRDRGEGINRVFSDVKPRRWFRFETSIGRSRAGDFDAFHLDYDNPANPFFIRAIRDEIRQVAPGLFLGQAYLVTRKRARLVLYFGLDAR